MPISIGTDPTKAFADLSRLEREIRSMIRRNGGDLRPSASGVSKGKRNSVRYTGALREKVADTVARTTKAIAADISSESPRWSYWLKANFNHAQGSKPSLAVTPTPLPREKGDFAGFVGSIIGNINLDGTKAQYIYNTVSYAEDVALGDFPAVSADFDWYLKIQQFHAGGSYVRQAAKLAAGGKK
jgi:hypothetical protein